MKPIYSLLIVVIIGPSLSLSQTGVYSGTGIQWCDSTDIIQQRLIECTTATNHLVEVVQQSKTDLNTTLNVTLQPESKWKGT